MTTPFSKYISNLQPKEAATLHTLITVIHNHVPDAEEGLSYGLPAFKYQGRPLIGFSSNARGLSLYPFDPKIITALKDELQEFELGKGVIRFSAESPIPKKTLLLLVDMRLEYLSSKYQIS